MGVKNDVDSNERVEVLLGTDIRYAYYNKRKLLRSIE
jgi:hypothetical protein